MIGEKLIAREAEVLRILEALHESNQAFTLIGGYAVDAYSPLPRYSVDLDLVIVKQDLGRYSVLFNQHGFEDEDAIYENELEGLETRVFTKAIAEDVVSIDLFVDGVRCRQTGAVWRRDEISKTSKNLRVVGVNGSAESRVSSREMLISLKLHSGRDPDLRDVAMLSGDADWTIVRTLIGRGSISKLVGQLEHAVKVLSGAGFEGELKSTFGTKNEQKTRMAVALGRIRDLLKELAASPKSE